MAVSTIDAVVSYVVRVAELKRLFDELVGARHVRRTAEDHDETDQTADQEKDANYTDAREGIDTAMKNLRHRILRDARVPALTSMAKWRARRGRGTFLSSASHLYNIVKKGSSTQPRS
jgi:hypothetical protein